MRVLPSPVPVRAVAAIAVGAALLAGCGGGDSDPLSSPGDKPKRISAEPQEVDACSLVTAGDVDRLLGLSVEPVTLEYGAAQVPTLTCGLGTEFGVADVSVRLATGPIALDVFEDAYGPSAGGTPEPLKRIGQEAFVRNEEEQLQVHALVNGAILTLTVASSTAAPVERSSVVELARIAADRLPDNPRLAPTRGGGPCAQVETAALTDAIGAAPTAVSSLAGSDGSLMCSWASRPGSVAVTVLREAARVGSYRRLLDEELSTEVEGVGGRGDQAWSRDDRAGDLLVFSGDAAAVLIEVVPTAGYSSPELPTTASEIALADAVVATVLADASR